MVCHFLGMVPFSEFKFLDEEVLFHNVIDVGSGVNSKDEISQFQFHDYSDII